MLVKAMEVSGIEGNFRSTCENVMLVLRVHKDSVMAMMEVHVMFLLLEALPLGQVHVLNLITWYGKGETLPRGIHYHMGNIIVF